MESILVFIIVALMTVGIVEEVVVPAANKAVDLATPAVEKVGDFVSPVVDKVVDFIKPEEVEEQLKGMYVLVVVAYFAGGVPFIRSSPVLYNTYASCNSAAVNVLDQLYQGIPAIMENTPKLVHLCAKVPEEA